MVQVVEVNASVVPRSNVFLPGEASPPCIVRFKAIIRDDAALAAMSALWGEESAESIVVVSESVSSCVPLVRSEGRGKPIRSKARTEEEETTGGDL